ncbi:dinucleotide-utilizing enzyme [Microbacterium horticulturae]|uniref:Dinucleotide-utilizing enzyme n=1 Tax=Microbacterium horticulturae TaxID=3028316 RepID=A0ABY8C1C0_9MICO|nr:dinucleotide-utilizing enzyme [Microbacterium sp. KACC 23027]WEG10223.1 dinucleotide-utilizing enzyme [Microbacterium sp. KACC 23027]
MSIRPRLVRNIPFWLLLLISLGATIGGALMMKIELAWMTQALAANTATGVDVYVGQPAVVVAGIICGAGVIGLLLTLTVAALAGLRPKTAVNAAESIDWQAEAAGPDESVVEADANEAVGAPTA